MDRIPDRRYSEIIGEGLDRLPGRIRARVSHVRFVCGVDPVFAGIHTYAETEQGVAYRDVAHCVYPIHQRAPRTAATLIVLPLLPDPADVVHELGHALDEATGFAHTAAPVTDYARTNRQEAFAEALVAWTHHYGNQDALHADLRTLALFRELAA